MNLRLQLSAPLYQGGLLGSRIREASLLYQRSRAEREEQARAVERQTRAAYWGVIGAIGQVEALRQSVVSLQLALESRQEGFKSGLLPSIEVMDGVRDLYVVRRDFARARYEYILNSLRLKRAVGTLGERDIAAINRWLE